MKYMVRLAWEIYGPDGRTIRTEYQESTAFRKAAEMNREIGENFDVEHEKARMNRRVNGD